MEASQLIISIVGVGAAVVFVVQSFRRVLTKRGDWLLARQDSTYPDQHLEIQFTHDLYTGQRLRFASYLSILIIFLTLALPVVQDTARLYRSILVLFVVIAFAVEETFLDRSRSKTLADIRAAREGRNGS